MLKTFEKFAGSHWSTLALVLTGAMLVSACAAASADPPEDLKAALETGHTADHYWEVLEQLGYRVTSVNYEDEDYVEYEVVKGEETYEIQIDLDQERRATKIEVTTNAWVATETAAAMDRVMVTVPEGTRMQVRLTESVSSDDSAVGDRVGFEVAEPVTVGDDTVIPAGSSVVGTVTHVEKAERPQKPGELGIEVEELVVGGDSVKLDAAFASKGKGSHEEDARDIGIGAAIGAIVGGIAEGAEGAIAGLVLGGGGVFLATKGENVELPAGTVLLVQLEEPIEVPLSEDDR